MAPIARITKFEPAKNRNVNREPWKLETDCTMQTYLLAAVVIDSQNRNVAPPEDFLVHVQLADDRSHTFPAIHPLKRKQSLQNYFRK